VSGAFGSPFTDVNHSSSEALYRMFFSAGRGRILAEATNPASLYQSVRSVCVGFLCYFSVGLLLIFHYTVRQETNKKTRFQNKTLPNSMRISLTPANSLCVLPLLLYITESKLPWHNTGCRVGAGVSADR